ncbi:MAG: TetR/AcrR family transcriptional regulator [Deltaproteobacteria bacterium]|nr:TetR/AcrR family transcriptional regulator [Deltaproteobacteria bacterium]
MVQRQKIEIREQIILTALSEFADKGYFGTTLKAIAEKSKCSIGNIYKYFSNKDELFKSAFPPSLVEQSKQLIKRRVKAIGIATDIQRLDQLHPYRAASEELITFTSEHRLQMIFLLSNAKGSRYSDFKNDIIEELTDLAIDYASKAYPGIKINGFKKGMLKRFYKAFIFQLVAILKEEKCETKFRDAAEDVAIYHLSGLKAFFINLEEK